VAVYDGESESASVLGRFCGDKIPFPISSTNFPGSSVIFLKKLKHLSSSMGTAANGSFAAYLLVNCFGSFSMLLLSSPEPKPYQNLTELKQK